MAQTSNRRERGTLQSTLPESHYATICIYFVVCAVLATLIYDYSRYNNNDHDKQDLLKALVPSGLGAFSTILGIVFVDPTPFAVSFIFSVRIVIAYFTFCTLVPFLCVSKHIEI